MMESLSKEARLIDISHSPKEIIKSDTYSGESSNRLKIRESVSWAICFAIIAGITGALLAYKIGVTMSDITSILFYFSLLGLVAFVARAVRLSRSGGEEVVRKTGPSQLN